MSEVTLHQWRAEYGAAEREAVKRLKELDLPPARRDPRCQSGQLPWVSLRKGGPMRVTPSPRDFVYLRNLISNYVGTAWTTALGVAFVPLYVSYLGLESYGVLGAFSVLQSVTGFIETAIAPLLIKEMSRYRSGVVSVQEISELRTATLRLMWLLVASLLLTVAAASPFLVKMFVIRSSNPGEVYAVAVPALGFAIVLRLLEGYHRAILIGTEAQVRLNVLGCALATLKSVGALAVLALVSPTLWAFGLWQLSIAALSVVAFASASPRPIRLGSRDLASSIAVIRSHWRFGAGLMLLTGLSVTISLAERTVLFSLLSLEGFGAYTLATTIAAMPTLISVPTGQVLNARLAALVPTGQVAESEALVRRTTQVMAVLVGAIGATFCVSCDTLIFAWTGSAQLVDEVSLAGGLLSASGALNAFAVLAIRCRLAIGDTRFWTISVSLAGAVCIPAYVLIAPRHGLIGAAWVSCAVNFLLATVASPLSLHSLLKRAVTTWLLVDALLPLAAASITAVLMRVVFGECTQSRWAAGALVASSVALSAVAAAACSGYVRRSMLTRLIRPPAAGA